jgi:basic membrane protein A and related proteins
MEAINFMMTIKILNMKRHISGKTCCLQVMQFICLFFLSSCDTNTTEKKPSLQFRVAMILPGSDSDHGWNQMAREGLDRIHRELSVETKLLTNIKPSEFTAQINYFANEGYDVVICHGGEFEKDVAKAAAAYPKTHFIVGGCPTDIPNAVSVEFMARDASFLVGLVAANVSKTKSVAFVGAMAVPTLQACYDGMKEGAMADKGVDANIKVLPALWTDSWDSPTRAKEKAESAINAGADVIYQNVDAAAKGVFEAVAETAKPDKPIYAFGCNSNQNQLAPQVILGSVVIDVQRAYLDLTREAKNGKLKNGPHKLGLSGLYVDLVLNEQHPTLTTAIKEKVVNARKQLLTKL